MVKTMAEVFESLSSEENAQLTECERTIERNLKGQFEFGAALAEIRNARLYRESHSTFEDYCSSRWDLQRPYAYQLMAAAATRATLAEQFDKLPANEFQARPLAKLAPEDQKKVWAQVVKQAGPEGQTPYKIVKGAVDDLLEARKIAPVDVGDAIEPLQASDNQFHLGDPIQLIAELPPESCDVLLIDCLSGSTPQSMADNLLELLTVSASVMRPDHQVLVIADLHDCRPLLEAAESLSYEPGVPLIWVTDRERSVSDWTAKVSTRAILHFRKGNAGFITQIGNVVSCNDEAFKHHADQRPLSLIRMLIETATLPSAMVLNPTGIAATANIACRQIGRACIGITSNMDAYTAGVERLNENPEQNEETI